MLHDSPLLSSTNMQIIFSFFSLPSVRSNQTLQSAIYGKLPFDDEPDPLKSKAGSPKPSVQT